MKIIFVGKKNHFARTLMNFLESYEQYSVKRASFEDLADGSYQPDIQADITIADLSSINTPAIEAIRILNEAGYSRRILALSIYKSQKLVEPLLDAGADRCLSLDTTEDELIPVLTDLSNIPEANR